MTAKTTNAKVGSDGLTVKIEGKIFCPANKFQQMVSGKHKLRILWALKGGWKRYPEIKRGLLTGSIGTREIAESSQSRAEDLSRNGNVDRRDHQVFPLKVEYRLTSKGRTFLPIIAVIHKWGMRHLI